MNRKLQRERTLAYWMVVAYGLIMFAVVWFTGCENQQHRNRHPLYIWRRNGYPETTYSYMAKHYLELEAQVKSLSKNWHGQISFCKVNAVTFQVSHSMSVAISGK